MSIATRFDQNFNQRQASYKMVTVLAMLENMSDKGVVEIDAVVKGFAHFYRKRVENGKLTEKEGKKMSRIMTLNEGEIKATLVDQPIPALRDLVVYDKEKELVKFAEGISKDLDKKAIKELRKIAYKHLHDYYKELNTSQITIKDLPNLNEGFAVTAVDISSISRQSQMKGIHPILQDDYKGVIILSTIGGEEYANLWLNHEETKLKYYLEGRRRKDGKKEFNLQIRTNRSIIESKEKGYPIHVFTRDKKGGLFHYEGDFLYEQVGEDPNGDKYFILKKNEIEGGGRVSIPDVSRERIIEAMQQFDMEFRSIPEWQDWEEKQYQKYVVLHNERKYPPKMIISLATGLPRNQFSGGEESNGYLRARGFIIEELQREAVNIGSEKQLVEHVYNNIINRGFVFTQDFLKNFYLSLKTKPFVILAGISGTGKSKLGELFAAAVGATANNGRYRLISVRPDWNDSTDLLGYQNLKGEFVPGPMTAIIKEALREPDKPYFVCLDEMNLARVEYYFSDFLSIIESRKMEDGKITSAPMQMHGLKEALFFPENLYVIGTVNMDETTHSFSRKVLDRANTIELTQVALNSFPRVTIELNVEMVDTGNSLFQSEYLLLKDCFFNNENFIKRQVSLLEEINEFLKLNGYQIGYRVRDEFCFYLLYNQRWGLLPEDKAVDYQIMQKILPRIQGSAMEIEEILKNLEDYCGERYPMSKNKIEFMLGRFSRDGFTSFWP